MVVCSDSADALPWTEYDIFPWEAYLERPLTLVAVGKEGRIPVRAVACPRLEFRAVRPVFVQPSLLGPTRAGQGHGGRAYLVLQYLGASMGKEQHPPAEVAGFEILEEINRGGMGVIYKARQNGLNRLVALKVIAPDRVGSPEAMKRFKREVQAAALLCHPNIVTVFHTDLEGTWPYLAMEYVPGMDLYTLVRERGPLSIADACEYAEQAAQGLQHAYEQGLVHRDIKPANLMITPYPNETSGGGPTRKPRVKILDMGLARVIGPLEGSPETNSLTQAGEFLGTPNYIAPEQAEDPRRADVRSDLYSLGGTLYFLLTGDVPFPSGNLMQKLRMQLTQPPPSPAAKRPEISPEIDAVVRRLLARDPAARYATPAEFIDDLQLARRAPTRKIPAEVPISPAPVAAPSPSSHVPATLVRAHDGGVQSLSVSSDGQAVFTGGTDGSLRLWHATRFKEIRRIATDVGSVEEVAFAPGGKWAASCSLRLMRQDMVVQLWDIATGTERRRLRGPSDTIRCVVISADGQRVAAGAEDTNVWVWNLATPHLPPLTLAGHTGTVTSLAFFPGGEFLLSGGMDGTIRHWDLKTGTLKGTINAQVDKVTALSFSGITRRLAVAGMGLRVRHPQGAFSELLGHEGAVHSVSFSGDGQLLLSGGSDRTVRLWRTEDGEELACLVGHTDRVTCVAFSPDANWIYSGSADGTMRRWPLPA